MYVLFFMAFIKNRYTRHKAVSCNVQQFKTSCCCGCSLVSLTSKIEAETAQINLLLLVHYKQTSSCARVSLHNRVNWSGRRRCSRSHRRPWAGSPCSPRRTDRRSTGRCLSGSRRCPGSRSPPSTAIPHTAKVQSLTMQEIAKITTTTYEQH